MPFEVLSRGKNLIVGAARLFDFQGAMTDRYYAKLYEPLRGGIRSDALKNDMRKLGADFQRVIELEQEQSR